MPGTVTLRLSHPDRPDAPVDGFTHLWAFRVRGYRPERHCQPCFLGSRVDGLSRETARAGLEVTVGKAEDYPCVYVCGFASGPQRERGARNLHLPLRYRAGAVVEERTWTGFVVRAENAERIDVPRLADDFAGLPREHARCRNFQLGVHLFGHPSLPTPRA